MTAVAAVVIGGSAPLVITAGANITLTPGAGSLTIAASGGGGGVTTFNGRAGAVVPTTGDYTAAQCGALALAGGTLVGTVLVGTDNTYDIGSTTKALANLYTNAVQNAAGGLVVNGTNIINFQTGAVTRIALTSANFNPTDNTVALGNATHRYTGLFVNGAPPITITGATTTTGAAAGTLTNCPTVGNPTGYLQLSINGAIGKIPYWT